MSTGIKASATARIRSRFNQFEKRVTFLLVPEVSNPLPAVYIDRKSLQVPANIRLADPEFHRPSEVDALLGNKLFYKLLCVGQIKIKGHEAVLQKTHLGWIVAGELKLNCDRSQQVTCNCIQTANPYEADEFTRFWDIEQVPIKKRLSPEEQACEKHLTENVKRDSTGRYTVKLPFN
ncbi:uncharacterized protein LOC117180694 [Belonocnema kinseyi]|uniref:uncharacterized protein LOC117180694 n=1 Tax=Belonocnema kinseyi TaxID=2817044 RepID=UPI00143DA5BB|nr:uncharacterized protein LOC117180694 [Belonocnema kinseyi]